MGWAAGLTGDIVDDCVLSLKVMFVVGMFFQDVQWEALGLFK